MTEFEDQKLEGLGADERRAKDALIHLSRPRPEGDFRARMKQRFVDGTLSAAEEPVVELPPSSRARIWGWTVVAVAAAAVLVAVLLRDPAVDPNLPRAARWQMLSHQGAGDVTIDGARIALAEGPGFDQLLHDGAILKNATSGSVLLICDRMFTVEISPGSELTLPRPQEANGKILCRLEEGTVRFSTAPEFSGNLLEILASDTKVEVHGTTLSVLASEEKTCVSVYEGEVEVRNADGTTESVPAGRCRTVFLQGDDPAIVQPLTTAQESELGSLLDRSKQVFTGRSS